MIPTRKSWLLVLFCCLSLRTTVAFADVTFVFTFFDVETSTGVGFDDPTLGADRRASLEAVGVAMGARIEQDATVEIGVAPSQTDGTGPIGIGSATFLDTAPGIRDGEVYRRIVLGEADVDVGLDAGIVFDFGYDMVLSGAPVAGFACFRDVARHELTHVLGYGSFIKADGTGFNETTPDMYTRFDSMLTTDAGPGADGLPIVDEMGNLLLDDATFAFANGTGLVFDGTESRAANSGAPIKLFAADPTHSGTDDDVMFPSPAVGDVREDWTEMDVAILKDLGYRIRPASETGGDGGDGGEMPMADTCGTCGAGTSAMMLMCLVSIPLVRRRASKCFDR